MCIRDRKRTASVDEKDMSELITLARFSSYRRRPVVWYVAEKEARAVRKTLEDFYYGNITPNVQDMAPNSELRRSMDRVARFEKQLMEQLDEAGQTLLAKLIESQQEIDSITAMENFILGFRLGVRMMAECMDNNDGDIRTGGE